jgi:hypothetical protein
VLNEFLYVDGLPFFEKDSKLFFHCVLKAVDMYEAQPGLLLLHRAMSAADIP